MRESRSRAFVWCSLILAFLLSLLLGAGLEGQEPNPAGLIYSDQWLALGPFSLPGDFDCDGAEELLLTEHIAPSSIAAMTPKEGDEIEYDPDEASTESYNGPLGPNENPVWRPFNDGTDIDGDSFPDMVPDDLLDLDQDAINVGSPADYVVTFVVTYFEYSGDTPIAVDLCIGSDDSVQVWLDRKLVWSNNDCRGHEYCADNVPAVIAPGLHRIAMTIFERGGSFRGSLGFKVDGEFITQADGDWDFLGTDAGSLVFPEAKFTTDVTDGAEPLTVRFDGSASSTPSGTITKYLWDFGDGTTKEGAQVTHIYEKASFYKPRLSVTNSLRGSDFAEGRINVKLPPGSVAPWASADIGGPALPGGERRAGSCLAVFGGGTTVGDMADQLHFTYIEKTGDILLTAQLDETLWSPGAIAGIMLRESLAPDSRMAFVNAQYLSGSFGIQYGLISRKSPGVRALASRGKMVQVPPKGYLRIERKGTTFATYTSPDGVTWTDLYSTIFAADAFNDTYLAGLAVAAGDSEAQRQSARITFCKLDDFGATGGTPFHRGDADSNGQLQLTDAVRILNVLFLGTGVITCPDAADVDDNGQLQLTDAVRILNVLFLGDGIIPAPGPTSEPCGDDPTPDVGDTDLGCAAYTNC